jgi:hypothetical protein
MNYEINRSEQYTLIALKEEVFSPEIATGFENLARDLFREGYHNIIVNLVDTKVVDPGVTTVLRKVNRLCINSLGVLVLVTKNDDVLDFLDDLNIPDLIILMSQEEAIDAVFMNDLENEFGAGDDDYDEEDFNSVNESNEP